MEGSRSALTEDQVRGLMEAAACTSPSAFPFDAIRDCELRNHRNESVLVKSLYESDKKTILMFGRNLL
jgi:hypothetical protein